MWKTDFFLPQCSINNSEFADWLMPNRRFFLHEWPRMCHEFPLIFRVGRGYTPFIGWGSHRQVHTGRVHTGRFTPAGFTPAGVETACLTYRHPSRVPSCRQSPERTTRTQAGDDSPCSQRNDPNTSRRRQSLLATTALQPHKTTKGDPKAAFRICFFTCC